MDRERIAARIRRESEALLQATGAHIVVTIVMGADGSLGECSSLMTPAQTAMVMERLTLEGRNCIAAINAS